MGSNFFSNPPWSEQCTLSQDSTVDVHLFLVGGISMPSWQSSNTCNITNIFMDAQMKLTTNVANENQTDQTNFIVINAECDTDSTETYCKKFTAKGTDFKQSNNLLKVSSLQAAFTSNDCQQTLNLLISQAATSLTKGLAILPQSSTSENITNAFMRAGVNINTFLNQSCKTTQNNTVVVNVENYNTVNLNQEIYDQDNTIDTQRCIQLAVTKNKVLQQLSASISQVASATSAGLNIVAILICCCVLFFLFVVLVLGETLAVAKGAFNIMGGILVISGTILMVCYFIFKQTKYTWFGASPGIASSCDSGRYTFKETKSFDKAEDAVSYAKDKKYVAFDYVLSTYSSNPTINPGTATFYSGEYGLDKCPSIVNGSEDATAQCLTVRNPVYINKSLAGSAPSDDIVGDVLLDTDTGNLWYKYPTNAVFGAPSTTWQKPSSLLAPVSSDSGGDSGSGVWTPQNQDNVFYDTFGVQKVTMGPTSKVYFYIPHDTIDITFANPKVTVDNKMYGYSASNPFGTTTKVTFVAGNKNEPAVSATTAQYTTTPSAGDYLVVPYPTGPAIDVSQTEMYKYGAVYCLYVAKTDAVTGSIVPNVTTSLPVPDYTYGNALVIINGYGVVPILQWENSTCIFYQKGNDWLLGFGIGCLLIGIMWIIFFNIVGSKSKAKTSNQQQTSQQTQQNSSSDAAAEAAS